MNWHIFVISKPRLPYARAGVEEYVKRLGKRKVELHFLKPSAGEKEILQKTEGMLRIGLDEQGEQISSAQLAKKISRWEQESVQNIALLIGGADGHPNSLKKQCHRLWSLSRLTLQHELALVIVLEQLYRAYSIKEGSPYHRG